MVYGLPTTGEADWGTKVNASIEAVKTTADAAETPAGAQAKADAAEAASVPLVEKGAASGVAPLDATQKLPEANVPDRLTEANLSALYAGLDAVKNTFTGKVEVKGTFTNPFDSTVWIAPAVRTNPTSLSQSLYAVHRVAGDMGAKVHDAMATELIAYSATNTTFLNAFESTVKLEDAGNSISDMRAGTFNFAFSSDAGGTVSSASVIVAQATPTLPAGLSITDLYGLYVEQQTQGTNNWSIYAPTGRSQLGDVTLDKLTVTGASGALLVGGSLLVRNSGNTGTFMQLGPTYLRWTDGTLQQTTVGAAGAAAALPAAPTKYLKVQDSAGTVLVIPAYAAA